MSCDERYFDCPVCGYSVLMTKPVLSNQCGGFCKNCEDHQFIKDSDDTLIRYCPICSKQLKTMVKSQHETRCESCGYKFEVYIPDEN